MSDSNGIEISSESIREDVISSFPAGFLEISKNEGYPSVKSDKVVESERVIPGEVPNKDTQMSDEEFKMHNLMVTAENLIQVARANSYKLHSSEANILEYYKLIKAAIGCLLVVIKKYSHLLNSELEAMVYLSLAEIYFFETESTDLAGELVNKAILIADRTNLHKIKFQAEYLAAQVLFKEKSKLGLRFLDSKIEEYSRVDVSLVLLFEFLKLKFNLATDPDRAFLIIKSILEKVTDPLSRQLALCYHLTYSLHAGDLSTSKSLISELETLSSERTIPQLQAFILLNTLWCSVLENETNLIKRSMSKVDLFVKSQKLTNWDNWSRDGKFTITMNINVSSSPQLREDKIAIDVPYEVEWLSSSDCLFMLYFMSGVAYIPKGFDRKGRALKFFDACFSILQSQEASLHSRSLKFQDHENAVLKARFMKIYLNYYQLLARFNSNDWNIDPQGKDQVLFQFVDDYDEGKCSSQELLVYHKLVTQILYLLGVYYHGKREYETAKNYYNRIRSHLKKSTFQLSPESWFMNDPVLVSLYQIGIGLGGDAIELRSYKNEIYTYASVNLLIIISYEIKHSKEEELFLTLSNARKAILADLNNYLVMPNCSNSILQVTIRLLKIVFNSSTLSESDESINTSENSDIIGSLMKSNSMSEITASYPILASVLFYLASYCTQDPEIKMKNLQTSYHYAKLARNPGLLSLSAYHVYQLMSDNDAGKYSIEELESQKQRYLNYHKLSRRHPSIPATNTVSSENQRETGEYDNEKNDDYYNMTGDVTL